MKIKDNKRKKSYVSLGVFGFCLFLFIVFLLKKEGVIFPERVDLQEALQKEELVVTFRNTSQKKNQYYYTGGKITPKVIVSYKVPEKDFTTGYSLRPLEQGIDVDVNVTTGKEIGTYDVLISGIEDKSKKAKSFDFQKIMFSGSVKSTYEIIVKSPTMKLNMSKIYLKKRQSTSLFKVTGLAAGDSVKEYRSSDNDVFEVDSNGKITAKSRKDSAVLYVTLASGKTGEAEVIVQDETVLTKDISVSTQELKLAKGQDCPLKVLKYPLTSEQEVIFSSSDKKIATVSSDGIVTGKGNGNCQIFINSGDIKEIVSLEVFDIFLPQGEENDFLNTCCAIANQILKDGDWIYSNGDTKGKFKDARDASVRATNCAHYVSLCAQEFGKLKRGQTFYGDEDGEIKADSDTMANLRKNFEIIDIGKQPFSAVKDILQPGDICIWVGQHTNIYVGDEDDGDIGWLDAGRNMTADGKYESGPFSRLYKTSSFEERNLSYILRVKNFQSY